MKNNRNISKKILSLLILILALTLFLTSQAFAGIIHIAANNGNLEKVKRLVSNNPRLVNEKDLNDKTPLHFAAFAGNPEIVEYLIKNGADIEAKDAYGMTPLHASALRSVMPKLNTDSIKSWDFFIKTLKEHKTKEQEYVWNKLDEKAKNIVLLTSRTGDIDNSDKSLIISALNKLLKSTTLFDKNIFPQKELDDSQKYLLASGLKDLSENNLGTFNRLLLESAFPKEISQLEQINGNYKSAEILIKKGANINDKGREGATALHLAILYDNDRIAELLIDKGADFNIRTNRSYTPLYYAYMKKNKHIVKLLESKGANQY